MARQQINGNNNAAKFNNVKTRNETNYERTRIVIPTTGYSDEYFVWINHKKHVTKNVTSE